MNIHFDFLHKFGMRISSKLTTPFLSNNFVSRFKQINYGMLYDHYLENVYINKNN
jgi:hypothetical protein